jgi:hypothetical protein
VWRVFGIPRDPLTSRLDFQVYSKRMVLLLMIVGSVQSELLQLTKVEVDHRIVETLVVVQSFCVVVILLHFGPGYAFDERVSDSPR